MLCLYMQNVFDAFNTIFLGLLKVLSVLLKEDREYKLYFAVSNL